MEKCWLKQLEAVFTADARIDIMMLVFISS